MTGSSRVLVADAALPVGAHPTGVTDGPGSGPRGRGMGRWKERVAYAQLVAPPSASGAGVSSP